MKKIHEVLSAGSDYLINNKISLDQASHIVIVLICFVTKKSYSQLYCQQYISIEEQDHFFALIKEIVLTNKPLAYVVGTAPFLDFIVDIQEPILIPRPETEWWCDYIITYLKDNKIKPEKLLDICTGSGCVALAFARAFEKLKVVAVDIDPKACELALHNVKKLNLINRVEVIESDLFDALPVGSRFDLIVSNPPYISNQEYLELDPSVLQWESKIALTDEKDGTFIIKKIIDKIDLFIEKSGIFVMEVDSSHIDEIYLYVENNSSCKNIQILYDQYEKPRVIMAFY